MLDRFFEWMFPKLKEQRRKLFEENVFYRKRADDLFEHTYVTHTLKHSPETCATCKELLSVSVNGSPLTPPSHD